MGSPLPMSRLRWRLVLPAAVLRGMVHPIGAPKRLHRATFFLYNHWCSRQLLTATRRSPTHDLSVCAALRRMDGNSFHSCLKMTDGPSRGMAIRERTRVAAMP